MMYPLIPTIDEPMSSLTYLTFWALIAGIGIGSAALVWWVKQDRKEIRREVSHEVERIEERIDKHDDYIDHTNRIISEIHVDIAVQKKSMENLESDIAEIKKDIKTLLKRQ